jgi:hypothetical protein
MVNAHRGAEVSNRRRVETANAYPGAVAVLDEAVESGQVPARWTASRHDEGEHAVGLQPAQREDESLEWRAIGPLGIVDQQQHRSRGLHRTQHVEQRRANPNRVTRIRVEIAQAGERRGAWLVRCADELLDDPEGEQLLRLLSARLPDLESLRLAHEPMRERGLADPRFAGQERYSRMTATHLGSLSKQAGQLVASADERPIATSTVGGHGEILPPIHSGFFQAVPKAPESRNSAMRSRS